MGYIGMCGLKGYGFLAILVVNRISIFWPFLSSIGYCFSLVLNWVYSLEEVTFSSLSIRPSTKVLINHV